VLHYNALFTLAIQALADIKLTGEALKKKLVEELDRYLLSLPPKSLWSNKRACPAAA
jgi:hypothetical protein